MAFRHFSCSNSRSEGALTLLSVHTPRIANEPEKKPLAFRERNALVQSIAERASFTFLYMLSNSAVQSSRGGFCAMAVVLEALGESCFISRTHIG